MKRAPLAELPFWPRMLSREEAARYLGVSDDVFDQEVKAGLWPPAMRRGLGGRRVTWDRCMLDRAVDRASGLEVAGPVAAGPADPAEEAARALEDLHATFQRNRVERHTREAR